MNKFVFIRSSPSNTVVFLTFGHLPTSSLSFLEFQIFGLMLSNHTLEPIDLALVPQLR